ncbi:MAG: ArnT family glycosyltransferase [Hyphomicrobium sp.]
MALVGVHLALAATLYLTEDEAYYRLWSLAPSLSYLDHPPMVAWLIALGRAIAGDTALGVRLLAPFLLALGVLVVWRTATLLYNRNIAICASWFFLAMPLLGVGGVIITPDVPSVAFYTLLILALAELKRTDNANIWLVIGALAGGGLLSKYTNLFAGATILIWVLAVPQNRRWLWSPQLWIGGAIALAISTPVLIWNWQHDWASFAKQFGRVGSGNEMGFFHPIEMWGGYFALASPLIALLSLIGLVDTCVRAIRQRDSADVLLVAAIAPLLIYFTAHTLHARVQANWMAPLYPEFAICAALGLSRISQRSRSATAWTAIFVGLFSTAAIYVHAVVPLIFLRKDPTGQMRGWPEFTASLRHLASGSNAQWISTSSYATTAQLAFAFRGAVPVAQLNERIRHAHLPRLSDKTYRSPTLYVELERRADERLVESCFADARHLANITRDDGTLQGARYAVYLAKSPRPVCDGDPLPPHTDLSEAPPQ